MQWQTAKGKKGGASFLQKALEGAVVSALGLGVYSDKDAQGKGKGAGKGGAVTKKKQFCQWKNCAAAHAMTPTIGDKAECHKCGKHFCNNPPLQMLVEWSFQQKLEEEKQKRAKADPSASSKGSKGGGKGANKQAAKGGGKGATAKTSSPDNAAEEEALRKKRLEELRAAKAGTAPVAPVHEDAGEIGIIEEVNAAWNLDGADSDAALKLDPRLAKELQDWDLQPMFESLKLDRLPGPGKPKTAEDVVTSILSESKPCTGAAAAVKLNAELEALKKTVIHYESEGLHDLKVEAEAKVKATAEKLERQRTPTAELQRKDVVAIKAQFIKDAQVRTETADIGKLKAADRVASRASILQKTIAMYRDLEMALAQRDAAIQAAYTKKGATIEQRDKEVCLLFDRKIEALAREELEANQASAAAAAPMAGVTVQSSCPAANSSQDSALQKALDDLEHFKQEQAKLMKTISDLQAAQASAAAAPQQAAAPAASSEAVDNDPPTDVWREFSADITKVPLPPDTLTAMEESDKVQVATLKAFCAAIPWGAPTPAVTFHVLGVHPSVAHGLTGTPIWEECWGEKHARITTEHIVPYSLFSVLKFAVERIKEAPDATAAEAGKNRWNQAKAEAAERRVRGKPY